MLLRSIALGRRWLDEVLGGATIDEIADRERCTKRRLADTLPLAFLAPGLVRAVIEARLPRGISTRSIAEPELEWSRQWTTLGISAQPAPMDHARHQRPASILPPDLARPELPSPCVADNKIALGAGWDLDLLKVELAELSSLGLDMDLTVTGFSTGELDVLLAGNEDPDDDVIPPVPSEPRTKPGDVWILGEHVVGCGDSRDREFLEKVVGEGARIDAAFLDPPYNVRISGHANAKGRHREFAMASGEMTGEAFRGFLSETLGAAARVSRDGAIHFICMDWRHMDDVSAVGQAIYGDLLNLCIWNKSNAGMGSLYRSKHELVFVYRVGTAPHFNAVELGRHGRNRTNVWDYASVNSLAGSRREDLALHPTVKPTALVSDAFQDVTRRGELVLDVFLGSGTTLIASERCGRRFRGLEIDPAYVDVAVDRWSAMTGGTPRLAERRKDP